MLTVEIEVITMIRAIRGRLRSVHHAPVTVFSVLFFVMVPAIVRSTPRGNPVPNPLSDADIARILQAVRSPEYAENILDRYVDWTRFTHEVMGNYWNSSTPYRRVECTSAFRTIILKRQTQQYDQLFGTNDPAFSIQRRWIKKGRLYYRITLTGGGKPVLAELQLVRTQHRQWRIVNIKVDQFDLAGHFRRYALPILKRYSHNVLIGELTGGRKIVIDDFTHDRLGVYPGGWIWKSKDNDKKKLFRVLEENGNKYMKLKDRGQTVIFARKIKWNILKYPYLSWRWRVHALPVGGDERVNETNDSAAAVYIIYEQNFLGVPKVIKWVWSTTLPVGTYTRRKGIGRPWTIVARSGSQGVHEWHSETFNALEAFRVLFHKDPNQDTLGIAVLTDANSTHSYAEADYDDFVVLHEANAGTGIQHFLQGGR